MGGTPQRAHVLLVGDVHRVWRDPDRRYLEATEHAACVFVGDLGDEDLPIVHAIADIEAPVLVMLGNHDAWASFSRRRPTRELLESLEVLGGRHLGYRVVEMPEAGVSLLGARPFSWGGPSLRSKEVYKQLYGVSTMEESAEKIVELGESAEHDALFVVAHNGPSGLSREPYDIWGKDFGTGTGDWGDRDLELAIEELARRGKRIVCVAAGHMHDRLKRLPGRERERFVQRGETTFVNPAVVPRRRKHRDPSGRRVEAGHFVRLTFDDGALVAVTELWIDDEGRQLAAERVAPRVLDPQAAPRTGTRAR